MSEICLFEKEEFNVIILYLENGKENPIIFDIKE